jgi:uncharacterized coiled-coil DUF342 family protein
MDKKQEEFIVNLRVKNIEKLKRKVANLFNEIEQHNKEITKIFVKINKIRIKINQLKQQI